MSEPESDVLPPERDVADRLLVSRPLPGGGFRGALGRHLELTDPGHGPRPPRLRATVAIYLALGLLLIAFGAARAVGAL
jgi:hypothetical protein